jgi:hypothetical protein
MPFSELRWIKRCAEYLPREQARRIPRRRRGIYVLFRHVKDKEYEVVYVGMAGGPNAGMRSRITAHNRRFSTNKWTHFSLFEVWDNISEAEVRELEGLVRHIFRRDPAALAESKQRGFKKLRLVRENKLAKW